jgi:hypothetical protein
MQQVLTVGSGSRGQLPKLGRQLLVWLVLAAAALNLRSPVTLFAQPFLPSSVVGNSQLDQPKSEIKSNLKSLELRGWLCVRKSSASL